jgi:uncharacterized protein YecT (DUF1311 family)
MKHAKSRDLKSDGTIMDEKIKANLELQEVDSLLTVTFNTTLKLLSTVKEKEMLNLAQEGWKKYRFNHCSLSNNENSSASAISFMNCCTTYTKKRYNELKLMTDEY